MSGLFNEETSKQAWDHILPAIAGDMSLVYGDERTQLAVVVMEVGNPDNVLFRACIGEADDEKGKKYANIALCKATISARTGKATEDVKPSELLPGETVFYGSYVEDNIVVAASGCKPYDDAMYSGWFALKIKALIRRQFESVVDGGYIWVPV